ncbi:J domain-containing protein [Streptomyces cylindrosporus]|uniref:J domain-containing protein n=1 Tax=Streptomyces cylindrosporus TaxID=2927583 RepID=A0ABS9Y6I7_9ACTN|nr:J domain-containing protein [Streptomyces cylindrosporus]MCI3272842.1 J domain-containing protein [Streptomyces cylindrosporus]
MPGSDMAGEGLFALPMVVPRTTEYSRLGVPPEATAQEIRAAAGRYDATLQARGASEDEIVAAHAVNLENAEARAEHDARFPPLPLLRLEPTWEPVLDERDAGLTVLRREIEDFLTAAGETVHHPMDTTRTDFTGDFTRTHLLDGLSDE